MSYIDQFKKTILLPKIERKSLEEVKKIKVKILGIISYLDSLGIDTKALTIILQQVEVIRDIKEGEKLNKRRRII